MSTIISEGSVEHLLQGGTSDDLIGLKTRLDQKPPPTTTTTTKQQHITDLANRFLLYVCWFHCFIA